MLVACPLSREGSMSRYRHTAAALLTLGLAAAPVYAATDCPLPGANKLFVVLEQQRAPAHTRLAQCDDKCVPHQTGDLMLLADDIPALRHLPLVSGPDEVASWHAEIFERLSERRDDDPALRYCQLML